MKMHKQIILLLLSIILCNNLFSQDLKAGEMSVSHVTGNQYNLTLTFYYETSTFVNRPYLLMYWGDGALDTIQWDLLTGGCGDANTFTKNFQKMHTYPGAGNYTISCVDSFRVSSINNIVNSNFEGLSLKYDLVINFGYPSNNSPISLNCATDTWTGTSWVYNSGSFDSDGDSLFYSIVTPPGLTNYTFPSYTINSLNGDFTLSPTAIGEYAICIKIDEWKLFPSTTFRSYFGSSYRNLLVNVSSLASIGDLADDNSLLLYPQPAHSHVFIEFNLTRMDQASICLKNAFGQTVKTIGSKELAVGQNKIEIDLTGLSSGIYFMQLLNSNKLVSTKFIKQ